MIIKFGPAHWNQESDNLDIYFLESQFLTAIKDQTKQYAYYVIEAFLFGFSNVNSSHTSFDLDRECSRGGGVNLCSAMQSLTCSLPPRTDERAGWDNPQVCHPRSLEDRRDTVQLTIQDGLEIAQMCDEIFRIWVQRELDRIQRGPSFTVRLLGHL